MTMRAYEGDGQHARFVSREMTVACAGDNMAENDAGSSYDSPRHTPRAASALMGRLYALSELACMWQYTFTPSPLGCTMIYFALNLWTYRIHQVQNHFRK
jgi:hypothetical protein